MVFSSIAFLFYFLPITLALYYILPKRCRNFVLLIASLIFYAYGEPTYVLIMILSITFSYIYGLLIDRFRKYSKFFLALSVCTSIGLLIYFKYTNFIIENINLWLLNKVDFINVVLPIGISFYTFQMLTYTVDLYKGNVKVQKNIFKLGLYITLFPQLIAGPIVRYQTIEEQLESRSHSFDKFALGVRRFVIGIGLGKMFGFDFLENFNYPYIAKSVTDFWRRWHISLSSFFRDYVYIPLGGNRVSKIKWFRNILIVWMLTGIWHGAAWNFIIWGLYFGLILVLEKVFFGKYLEKIPSVFSRIYVLLTVIISFIIFSGESSKQIFENLGGLIGYKDIPLVSQESIYYFKSYFVILIIGIIGSTPIMKNAFSKGKMAKFVNIVEPIFLIFILLLSTSYIIDGSFNPFLYFRF